MKYKVGDKVKYDGGDCWFCGTVSAVFEHSISPCYRLSVERIQKKSCKFSITQFEFEIEAYEEVESDINKREWEKPEIDKKPRIPEIEKQPRIRKTTDAWEKNFELYRDGKKSAVINAWKSKNRKDYKTGILSKDKIDKLMEINFSFDVERKEKPLSVKTIKEKVEIPQKPKQEPQKRKRGDAWTKNLEAYLNGEKSSAITTWIAENRKQYRTGNLSEDRLEKLKEINFPFDIVIIKKLNSWDRLLEEWKKGDRKSIKIQQWKQRSIRRFIDGKLAGDRIAKLKEVGILK